jgi:hypothetical protein
MFLVYFLSHCKDSGLFSLLLFFLVSLPQNPNIRFIIMKKMTFLFVVMAMFALTTNAQKKEQMYVGGTLGFSTQTYFAKGYSSTGCMFSVAPEFGYFVADRIKVGAELEYGISGGTHTLLVMPNVAYYLPIVDKLYYTPQFSIGGGFGAGSGYINGAFAFSLNIGALEYQPVQNMAISLSIVDLSYAYVNKTNGLGFNFLTSPTVGFRYYF